jgi:2,3,4,5-tetrahydropyridine-2-carboxylate N-succinyltransferase
VIDIPAVTAGAYGLGLATVAGDGTVLDTYYPDAILLDATDAPGAQGDRLDRTRRELEAAAEAPRDTRTLRVVSTRIASLAEPPADTSDAYLRLHLLSLRLVRPNSINLEGIFALLPINAWTNVGPVRPEDVTQLRLTTLRSRQTLTVHGVDRFPRMTDYVVPTGVRIADANRVRLGAYLSPGTVVMHEGFCNYNAGTLGRSMVEGRISQGVVVGDGSDIGGGASTMGTLSGGGEVRVSLGERCLIGANAGVGIPLGDDCIVEAGLYVTAGTKVALYADGDRQELAARALAGASGLLFRRHSLTGEVQALPHSGAWSGLNAALHAAD